METSIVVSVAATVGIETLKHIKKFGYLRKALVKYIPKHDVLVIGSTGTGKTNLVDKLGQVQPSAIDRFLRTNRSKEYVYKIDGKHFKFIDIPGQDMSESERLETIREYLPKVEGILHVVSYGYHEGSNISIKDVIIDENNPNQTFLENHRKEEINDIIELSKYYGEDSKATWLITVISKADLWWNKREEVVNYYSSGEYDKAIKDFLHGMKRGCVEYCSVLHKFYDILRLSGDFDDKERINCKIRFISILLEMALAKKRKK